MSNPLFERIRGAWENLNDRERRMLAVLGAVLGAVVLVMPPVVLALDNQELASENAALRDTIEKLAEQRGKLSQLARSRKADEQRFNTKTPPLGSFMESKAKEQGLTLQEVTDQPGKSTGQYIRRGVKVTLPQVGLSPVINLLSSIAQSPYPVAIDHIQIDHYQPGDQYTVKLGVTTFDKQGGGAKGKTSGAAKAEPEAAQ